MISVNPKNPRGLVWIASYPKSGNTWVRIFLYHMTRQLGGHARTDHDLDNINRASGYEARLIGLFEEIIGKPFAEMRREEVASARMQVHEQVVRRSPNIALLKTHNYLGTIAGHPLINLDVSAGAIYIVRDPRDVVLSLADHHGAAIDQTIEIMGKSGHANDNREDAVFEAWGSWSENVQGWTMVPDEASLVVRYEDLLAEPHKNFTSIARHLRQQPTEEQINEAVALSTFKELASQEAENGFSERSRNAERFFRVGQSGQWKDALSDVQVARIEDDHREQMTKFGYITN
jgi:hypothetical protein